LYRNQKQRAQRLFDRFGGQAAGSEGLGPGFAVGCQNDDVGGCQKRLEPSARQSRCGGASFYMRLDIFSFIPQVRDFRKQINLDLLNFNQTLPLVRQEVIDFFVQVPDFKFGF
jgi:hypothetical protein